MSKTVSPCSHELCVIYISTGSCSNTFVFLYDKIKQSCLLDCSLTQLQSFAGGYFVSVGSVCVLPRLWDQ